MAECGFYLTEKSPFAVLTLLLKLLASLEFVTDLFSFTYCKSADL